MLELAKNIPVDVLLELSPEELGAEFLSRSLRKRRGNFNLNNLFLELWPSYRVPGQEPPYPETRKNEINLAIAEAFAWLQAQGLIIPSPDQGNLFVLSRRAKQFASKQEFVNFEVARLLPKKILHPTIADKVWRAFMGGDYDDAAFKAMRAVEISVRDAAGIKDAIGVKLMREAFRDNGPLADMSVDDPGERVARMELFAGAIGSYKNPYAHRDIDLNDPAEAVEIILLANHLLRIVDARKSSCTKVAQASSNGLTSGS